MKSKKISSSSASKPQKAPPSQDETVTNSLLDQAEDFQERGRFREAQSIAQEILSSSSDPKERCQANAVLGDCARRLSQFDNAQAHLDEVLNAIKQIDDRALHARALAGMGLVATGRGQFEAGLANGHEALALALESGDIKNHLRALNTIGASLFGMGRFQDSLQKYEELLALANESNLIYFIIVGQQNIGNILIIFGRHAEALERLLSVLPAVIERKDPALEYRLRVNIGQCYKRNAQYPAARSHLLRAMEVAEASDNQRGVMDASADLIDVHYQLGEYEQSVSCALRGMEISKHFSSIQMQGVAACNVGNAYARLGDYRRGIEYHTLALKIAEEIKALRSVMVNCSNLGEDYLRIQDYEKAKEYYSRALEISRTIGDAAMIGTAIDGVAKVDLAAGAAYRSVQGFQEALSHFRNVLKSGEHVANTLLHLADAYLALEHTADAVAALTEALAIARQTGQRETQLESHLRLSRVFELAQDFQSAHQHLKEHSELSKDVYTEAAHKTLEAFRFRGMIEKQEEEKQLLEMKARSAEEALANKATHLAAQTELVSRFRTELRQIRRELQDPVHALKAIDEKLKELPCESVDWIKFEKDFLNVHPDFPKTLSDSFPKLTKQEIKMCQLARVGLKTYEMARLLCLSDRTIDRHRNSLRKKLGLKPADSLSNFLQSL